MIIDPACVPANINYRILVGAVVPRPIAFVSTVSTDGVYNLAPFSFFNVVCGDPPVVCFSPIWRNPPKDTIVNIRATREFVVNIVSEEIVEKMNVSMTQHAKERAGCFEIVSMNNSVLDLESRGRFVSDAIPAAGDDVVQNS